MTFATMSGRRLAFLAVLAFALAGCGGSGGDRLATVGGHEEITRGQVDTLVQHANEEVAREGQTAPAEGTEEYRALQRQALAVLVGRARIVVAAKRLGVTVDDAEIDRWASRPHVDLPELVFEKARRGLGIPEASEKGTNARLLRDAVRVQLTIEKVRRRLGDAGFERWYAKTRQLAVEYADGWSPNPQA